MNEWPDDAGESRTSPQLPGPAPMGLEDDPARCGCDPSGGLALRKTVRIVNSRGLHARAAAKLVTVAERFSACVSVSRHGQTVPACSIMGLMMLSAGQGSDVMVEAEGWDAKEALEAITELMEAGFHED